MPGGRSSRRYRPAVSVVAVRVFSRSAGLAASTVTPDRGVSAGSRTNPAIAPCAKAAGALANQARITRLLIVKVPDYHPVPGTPARRHLYFLAVASEKFAGYFERPRECTLPTVS